MHKLLLLWISFNSLPTIDSHHASSPTHCCQCVRQCLHFCYGGFEIHWAIDSYGVFTMFLAWPSALLILSGVDYPGYQTES